MSISEKKQRLRLKRKIKFEKEVVTKSEAQKLLEKSEKHPQKPPKKAKKENLGKKVIATEENEPNGVEVASKKRKRGQSKDKTSNNDKSLNTEEKISKKKKGKESTEGKDTENPATEEENVSKSEETKGEQTESIRSRKRKKHQQLLEEKKLKSQFSFQQKCLNYLSEWKHSKSTWKFEKLKQIWIQENMFNDAKIPDEFWDTVVEYFNNAKGKIKQTITSSALKIVEANTNSEENEEGDVKYKRARFIIQNLQE